MTWVTPLNAADVVVSGPYGATNVQEALDISRRTFGGNFGIVDNIDDLDFYAPPDTMTGERLLAADLWLSDTIELRSGEWITYANTSGVLITPTSRECGIIGDVDAALIRGPAVAKECLFQNNNVGASAKVFDITSVAGRPVRLEYCRTFGPAPLGNLANTLNVVTIERLFVDGASTGLVCTGTIVAIEFLNCIFSAMPAGHVAVTMDSGTTIILALGWDGCSFLTNDASDRGIRISDAATIPGAAVPTKVVGVNVIDCKLTGPGEIYDEGAGALQLDDPKIVTEGNPNIINSRYKGDVDFKDYVTPIVLSYGAGPAPTPWQVVPSENAGPTTLLTLLASSARFSLFRDPADPVKWYIQADGPTRQNVQLTWNVSLESSGGGAAGNFLEFQLEKQILADDPWVDPWTVIEGSDQRLEQRAQSSNNTHITYDVADVGDRYRMVVRNFTATGLTALQHFNVTAARS